MYSARKRQQVSQEAGKVVWHSHLLKNFPQFIVIHTVKGFGIVSKAEIDVFLELFCFFRYQAPPSMGFSRQEYWSGLPLPSPVFLPREFQRERNLVG